MRTLLSSIAAATLIAAISQPVVAQRDLDQTTGVIVVAHGGDPGWNAPVETLAAQVRQRGVVRGPIGVAFLMGDGAKAARFQDVAADLVKRGAKRIVVVPLLVSSHSGHYDQIRYLAGELEQLDHHMMMMLDMAGLSAPTGIPMVVTRALDDSPELANALSGRAIGLASDRASRGLLLFGHGPNSADDYASWMKNLRVVADSVRVASGYASVTVELVRDDAPVDVRAEAVKRARELVQLQHAATHKDVVVVPILVSSGSVSQKKLPNDLSALPIIYGGQPLLPDTNIVRWVERRVVEARRD